MRWPNFLIVGAQKAGTTALYYYLQQHPQVYMAPEKEPRFFAAEEAGGRGFPYQTVEEYVSLFDGVTSEQAIGEASTLYMYSSVAAQRIYNRLPSTRLVAMLRNPAERAYSAYLFARQQGEEQRTDFAELIRRDLARTEGPREEYVLRGCYGEQLGRFYDLFNRDQIRVYDYSQFKADPLGVMRDLLNFIGVDPNQELDVGGRHNASTIPSPGWRLRFYRRLADQAWIKGGMRWALPGVAYRRAFLPAAKALGRAIRPGGESPAPLAESARRALEEFYEDDIREIERLTGLDLGHWFWPAS